MPEVVWLYLCSIKNQVSGGGIGSVAGGFALSYFQHWKAAGNFCVQSHLHTIIFKHEQPLPTQGNTENGASGTIIGSLNKANLLQL